jgi:hypothetical protein
LPGGKFGEARGFVCFPPRAVALRLNRHAPVFARLCSVLLTPQIASIFQIKPLRSSRPLLYSGVLLE